MVYELNMEIKKNAFSGVFEAALSNGYHIFTIPRKKKLGFLFTFFYRKS